MPVLRYGYKGITIKTEGYILCIKGKVIPLQARCGPDGGGEWSAARPGRTLPPGKTRYTFYRRMGGPQGRSGRAENLVPTGNFFFRSRTVQPVVSRYTD